MILLAARASQLDDSSSLTGHLLHFLKQLVFVTHNAKPQPFDEDQLKALVFLFFRFVLIC